MKERFLTSSQIQILSISSSNLPRSNSSKGRIDIRSKKLNSTRYAEIIQGNESSIRMTSDCHYDGIFRFQGLFRNFSDAFLNLFRHHLERLSQDKQESSQRCVAEIVAGLVMGTKHWNFDRVKEIDI